MNKYLMCGTDASMGWALTPQQVGPKRLAQKTPIKNLLLSGHWTAPAVGVMSTVVSGLQASGMILRSEGVKEPLADIGIRQGVLPEGIENTRSSSLRSYLHCDVR